MGVNSRPARQTPSLCVPRRALWLLCAALCVSAASAQVVINEVMANNQTVIANDGQYSDWVELYNPFSSAINIGDWSLSDSLSSPRKFVFPTGTTVSAGGFLVVWLDSETNSPGLHTRFSIGSSGDDVTLFGSTAMGGIVMDRVAFGLQPIDQSIGRVPDGSATWTLTRPTFELPNQAITLGPAVTNHLRINEIMAAPSSGNDWFELYNTTTNYIALGGLVFTDQPSGATNRAMPELSFIAPGGFIEFIADAPNSTSFPADHVDFKLSNSGERVVLYQADR